MASLPSAMWESPPSSGGYVAESGCVEINAPLELVWRVLAVDVEQYADWNSFVTKLAPAEPEKGGSTLSVGSLLAIKVAWQRGDRPFDGQERVTRVCPPTAEPAGSAAGSSDHASSEGDAPLAAQSALWAYDYAGLPSKLGLIQSHRVQQLYSGRPLQGPTRYESFIHFRGCFACCAGVQRVTKGFERQAADLKRRCEELAMAEQQPATVV